MRVWGSRSPSILSLLGVLALLLLPNTPPPTQAEGDPTLRAGVTYVWWNPREGGVWHFRLPLLVLPRYENPVVGGWTEHVFNWPVIVQTEIDFTQAVRDRSAEGLYWPRDSLGRLSSWTLDVASLRVVAYNFESGQIDTTQGRGGVVPYTFTLGPLKTPGGFEAPFNASTNAAGTLTFLSGSYGVPFDRPRLYFVYFDIREYGEKPPPDFTDSEMAPLRSLYWIRSGTVFYGYAPPSSQLRITIPFGDTVVAVLRYPGKGLDPQPIPLCRENGEVLPCIRGGTTFELPSGVKVPHAEAGDNLIVPIESSDDQFFFKVVSSRPVLVSVKGVSDLDKLYEADTPDSPQRRGAIYPSLDSGVLGRFFAFLPFELPPNPQSANPWFAFAFDRPTTVRTDYPFVDRQREETTIPAEGVGKISPPPWQGGGYCACIVRVESTSPILLFSSPYASQSAVPYASRYGLPIGSQLYGPQVATIVALSYADTNFRGRNVEDSTCIRDRSPPVLRIYPPCEGTKALRSGAARQFTFAPSNHPDSGEPWTFFSTPPAPLSFMAGDGGFLPVGGLDARRFEVYVPSRGFMVLFALFNGTRVSVEKEEVDVQGNLRTTLIYNRTLGENDFEARSSTGYLFPATSKPAYYRVVSSKPILVDSVSTQGYSRISAFYQGLPPRPEVKEGRVEFFGPLVGWKEKTLTGTFKPGDVARFTLVAMNLGRGQGNSTVEDDLYFTHDGPTSGPFRVNLQTAVERGVRSGESRDVVLSIRIDPSVKTGTTFTVNVTLQSGTNPKIQDTARVSVSVQTRFGFLMTFVGLRSADSKTLTALMNPGEERSFRVRIHNIGTGSDNLTLTLNEGAFGFSASVLDLEGRDLTGRLGALFLPEAGSVDVFLVVRSPRDESPLQFDFTLQGTSGQDSAVVDQVTASVSINFRTEFSLRGPEGVPRIRPGSPQKIPLSILNEGANTDVLLSAELVGATGWNVTLNPSVVSLRAQGQVVPFNATIRAPPLEPVGKVVTLVLEALSLAEGPGGSRASSTLRVPLRVSNSFNVTLSEIFPQIVDPGENVTYVFDLTSRSNGPLNVTSRPRFLPPGWVLGETSPSSSTLLVPGSVLPFSLTFAVRPGENPQTLVVPWEILLKDTEGTNETLVVPLTLTVRRVALYHATPETLGIVRPGGNVSLTFRVTSTGNVPLDLPLSFSDLPLGVRVRRLGDLGPVHLEVGETKSVPFVLEASSNLTLPSFTVTLEGTLPSGETVRTPVRFEVGSVELHIERATLLSPSLEVGTPALVEIVVRNNGTLSAHGVEVVLLGDGKVLRNATLGVLPPSETRVVRIPWNVLPIRNLTAAVDPFGRFPDSNRNDNFLPVALPPEGIRTPFEGIPLLLGLLGGIAWGWKRR